MPPLYAKATSDFTITPAFQTANLDASGGTRLTIEIANATPADQSFKLSVADFGSLNESGGVAFLGAPASELDHRYGLVSWLQLSQNVVFVKAGGTAEIGATVENRASLAPGGHYGAVLATAITDTGAVKPLAAQVGLKAVLSSLILLTKSGGALPQLKLLSETYHRTAAGLPTVLDQRFQNQGNVHVVPRGIVEIRDPAGRVVRRGILNEDSSVVLPESFRRISVGLQSMGKPWLPGRYSITTMYRFDGTDTTKVFQDSTWYAGDLVVIMSWIVLTLVVAAIGWRLLRKRVKKIRLFRVL
jgi:hypothetical protein